MDDIHSTICVKQVFPLSPTPFGLYIVELEHHVTKFVGDLAILFIYGVSIAIVLFADGIILPDTIS